MKQKVQKTHTQRTSRLVAFAAVIGLVFSAMFASTASAIMIDTDPVIEVDGSCNLFGPGSPSGIWLSITNNDSWDEDYVIGVFEGIPEEGDMPTEIVELTVESEETEEGPIFIDTVAATVQVIDLSEYDIGLVYDEFVLVCFPTIPDFDFDEDDGDEEVDEGGEPVIVEDGSDEDDGAEAIDDEFADILPDFDSGDEDDGVDEDDAPVIVDDGVEEVDEGDAPVIVEDGSDEDDGAEKVDEGDEPVIVEGDSDEDNGVEKVDEGDAPVIVEDGSDEDDVCDCVDASDTSHPLWETLWGSDGNNEEGDTPVIVWENVTNDNSLDTGDTSEIGVPPEPEINSEDTDEGDEIGVPPEPEINSEDTDEAASSEGNETQGSSGLSLLWIILIIVASLVTVGTATRKLQKNNS